MTGPDQRPRAAAAGAAVRRVRHAWNALEREQRTAAAGALALFVTMFLPWYSRTAVGVSPKGLVKVGDNLTAFQEFSFVEAAVLLVAVSILWMLFARGEGKAFHLPFGDGNVIFAAGLWVCLLVFYRQFDKPSPGSVQGLATTVGVSWGIFVTFLTGLFIAFSGQRLRSAHLAEPPLPGAVAPSDEPRRRERPRPTRGDAVTVVAPRGRAVDETLVTEVPEYPRRTADRPPVAPPAAADPPTGPTRVVRPGDGQLRLDDVPDADPDGQLRFDG